MLLKLRFFIGRALQGMWHARGVTALSIVTIGVALALLAAFGLAVESLKQAAEDLGEEVALSAFLSPNLDAKKIEELQGRVEALAGVKKVEYLSSDAAMAEFRASLKTESSILDGLPNDLIPPSLEARLVEKRWTSEQVRDLAASVKALPGVDDVRYGQDDFERVMALLDLAKTTALIVGIAVSLSIVLLVFNTIRLAVYSRRDEIEILSLIGATNNFVRAPFVVEGGVQGLMGGLLASIGVWTVKQGIIRSLGTSLDSLGMTTAEVVPVGLLITVVFLGVGLGLFGSTLAVGRFVRI